MAVRGLLLDLDGTIADTLPHLFQAFRHAVEPYVQRPPTDAEIIATFGPQERECIERLLADPQLASPPQPDLSHEECVRNAVRRYHEYYEGQAGEIRMFPGMIEVLEGARRRGWRLGVFTGKGRRSAVFTLRQLGLVDQIDSLITSNDVSRPKPDPEGVLRTLAQLHVDPPRLIVVGDTAADIAAGRAAGVQTAAALWGAFDREATLAAGPTWAFESAAELAEMIRHQ